MQRPIKSKRQLKPKRLPGECLCCGTGNPWVTTTVLITAPFREVEHSVSAQVHQCRHCDAVATTEDQSEALLAKARETHTKWISEKLKAAQKELGLSLRELAEKSAIPFATLGRISSGDHLVEATVERLLWLEIGKLTHARNAERWIRMAQQPFRVTNGSIRVKGDPKQAGIYSGILNAASLPALGKSGDSDRKEDFRNLPCTNPVAA
ncbi:MAG: hypothetical protein J0M04_25250 [Verrucomicrobia bacterium]|nr:hypothetical protein [Verrucomicrobiota bacterium]